MPIPENHTYAEALSCAITRRKFLWSNRDWMRLPENRRITELQRYTTQLMGGDKAEGVALAREALYRDSVPANARE